MIIRPLTRDLVDGIVRDPWGAGGGLPDHLVSAWNFFGSLDPIVGPDATFSVPSTNYNEDGVAIGLVPRIDAGKGLWGGPQVANLLPASAADSSTWLKQSVTVDGYVATPTAVSDSHYAQVGTVACVSGRTYVHAFRIKPLNGQRYVQLAGNANQFGTSQYANFDLELGIVTYSTGGTALIERDKVDPTRFWCTWIVPCTITGSAQVTACIFIPNGTASRVPSYTGDGIASLEIDRWMVAESSVPVPYVPPGCTQSHNYATTGGNGLNIPMDAGLTAAYSGQNSFLDRFYLGFSSAQVSADMALRSVRNATADVLYISSGGVIKSSDGTNTATVTVAGGWPVGQIISLYRRTTGAQMQVGYRKDGESAITWGALTTYAGSDNPGTHERICLNATLPPWIQRKVTANKYCTDSELLEMEALAA